MSEKRDGLLVAIIMITLPKPGGATPEIIKAPGVRLEAQPFNIIENRRFILRPIPSAVMIFHPKDDGTTETPSQTPGVNRIEDVAEVQVSGWTGRKPRDRGVG